MRSNPQTPSLARLSAIILGLVLSASVSLATAQSLPDVQRLMKQNQMPQALEKVDLYISSKPKDAQGRFLKGLILTDLGRPADAIAVFTKLTEDFPELPEPYNNLAVLYAQQKQYDKARASLEMAIRTHPSYSIAHENLGDVYAKLASQAYDKALQLDSSNAATQTKLSMIKELISTSSKPGAAIARPAVAARPAVEPPPVKVAAAEAAKSPVAAPPAAPAASASASASTPAPVKPAVEPAAAAKAPEAKAVAEKAPLVSANEAEINKTLLGWASAWSRKDVKAYLAYYSSDFQPPGGMSRKAWEAERTQRIDKPGKLQVKVDDVRVAFAGDKATVRFRQDYASATLKSSAGKTMVFVKSGNKWLIAQERIG
jgi:ketosteroid isomerase-like protein/regulator of sirC expression with transglutaminase-like and TPR domain